MATPDPDPPADERRRNLDGDDSGDSDENVLMVERTPPETKTSPNDTDVSSEEPASVSSRKRPATEGFDVLKTLSAPTKKRNTEGPNAHALESRTKRWKDGPKSSSDGSTDPDGSKDPSLRSARPRVSEKLESLSQILDLMKLHQRTLDDIPPPTTKDKELKKHATQKAHWKQLQDNRKA